MITMLISIAQYTKIGKNERDPTKNIILVVKFHPLTCSIHFYCNYNYNENLLAWVLRSKLGALWELSNCSANISMVVDMIVCTFW